MHITICIDSKFSSFLQYTWCCTDILGSVGGAYMNQGYSPAVSMVIRCASVWMLRNTRVCVCAYDAWRIQQEGQ